MNAPQDYRSAAKALKLYSSDPLAGSGLPLWLPAGAIVREELQRMARDLARAGGCQGVYSPVLGKRELYEKSGHLGKFAADMFPPMAVGGEDFYLRPANCPHHALIYKSEPRRDDDLPLRFNELASMFRAEQSGAVGGLHRVREIHLDDSHVFCRLDQLEAEAYLGLEAALQAQEMLEIPVSHVRLSLRDSSPAYLGEARAWAEAERALRSAADRLLPSRGLALVPVEGEAAFYGPKLDLQVDRGGSEESVATVQVDFAQPERFALSYRGPDGVEARPVMVHRGAVGSMERVVAHLLEAHGPHLPFWLAPLQIAVLPVQAAHLEAARRLHQELSLAGLRSELFGEDERLGSRIRKARLGYASVLLVLGEQEVASGQVQVNGPEAGLQLQVDRAAAVACLARLHQRRVPKSAFVEEWERL